MFIFLLPFTRSYIYSFFSFLFLENVFLNYIISPLPTPRNLFSVAILKNNKNRRNLVAVSAQSRKSSPFFYSLSLSLSRFFGFFKINFIKCDMFDFIFCLCVCFVVVVVFAFLESRYLAGFSLIFLICMKFPQKNLKAYII